MKIDAQLGLHTSDVKVGTWIRYDFLGLFVRTDYPKKHHKTQSRFFKVEDNAFTLESCRRMKKKLWNSIWIKSELNCMLIKKYFALISKKWFFQMMTEYTNI